MTETTNPATPPLAPSVNPPLAPSVQPTPPAATVEAPKTFWERNRRRFLIGVAIIVGLNGINQIYKAFTPQLPGCAAEATANALREIFKKKNIELTVLNDMTTVSETSSLQSCQAHIETTAETATVFYNITLQGSNFQVLITKADAKNC